MAKSALETLNSPDCRKDLIIVMDRSFGDSRVIVTWSRPLSFGTLTNEATVLHLVSSRCAFSARMNVAVKRLSARRTFKSNLTRINLHRLWMQRGEGALSRLAHIASDRNRSSICSSALVTSGCARTSGTLAASWPAAPCKLNNRSTSSGRGRITRFISRGDQVAAGDSTPGGGSDIAPQ